MIELTDQEFIRLRDYVMANFGIDLTKKRVLIQGRLNNTLVQYGMDNFSDYIDKVMKDKSGTELQMMLNKLTTNLTFFMREKEHFQYLTNTFLPEADQLYKGQPLRVWSAGCSSGEEPYTLAMTLLDYYGPSAGANKFVVLASDLSQNVLGQAHRGVYTAEGLKDVPKDWPSKYFDKVGDDEFRVKDKVRNLITFKIFNLMEPFNFKAPFELIFCRNVMIYFEKQKKDELIGKFFKWTAPGGLFCISHSENIGRMDTGFRMVRPSTFRKD